jgi:hypothetical protein
MNYLEPYKIQDINLDKIVYPTIQQNKNKKLIFIKYNDDNKLKNFVFQIPTLLNINTSKIYENYSEIELALVGKNYSKINIFKKFLSNLENKIKDDANEKSDIWFNTSDNQTVNFQKIIRNSEQFNTGTIKLKLIKTLDFETVILFNNKIISPENIPNDSWCKTIIECYAIWITTNNDFGIFLRPIVVSFLSKEIYKYKYKFVDESEEENEFELPDTDVNHNIFIKSNNNKNDLLQQTETSQQLDINELIKHLKKTDEPKLLPLENIILNDYSDESENETSSLSDSSIKKTNLSTNTFNLCSISPTSN